MTEEPTNLVRLSSYVPKKQWRRAMTPLLQLTADRPSLQEPVWRLIEDGKTTVADILPLTKHELKERYGFNTSNVKTLREATKKLEFSGPGVKMPLGWKLEPTALEKLLMARAEEYGVEWPPPSSPSR
ncbi:MAG: hypothetical protein WDN72_01075 [Alphaproteobacteria bacterium]